MIESAWYRPRRLVTPRRWDIAVKWRLFHSFFTGDDPVAVRNYLWHIAARSRSNALKFIGMDRGKYALEQYLNSARSLFESMRDRGFDDQYPIPIDRNGELLDGAHRLSCALALDVDVFTHKSDKYAWAPPWGEEWFIENNCEDINIVEQDFNDIISGDFLIRAP